MSNGTQIFDQTNVLALSLGTAIANVVNNTDSFTVTTTIVSPGIQIGDVLQIIADNITAFSYSGFGSGNFFDTNNGWNNVGSAITCSQQSDFSACNNLLRYNPDGWVQWFGGGGIPGLLIAGTGGVTPYDGVNGYKFVGNLIDGCTGDGIHIKVARNGIITGNTISNTGHSGITMEGNSGYPGTNGVTITGNSIKNAGVGFAASTTTVTTTANAGATALILASTAQVTAGMYAFIQTGYDLFPITAGTTVLSVSGNTINLSAPTNLIINPKTSISFSNNNPSSSPSFLGPQVYATTSNVTNPGATTINLTTVTGITPGIYVVLGGGQIQPGTKVVTVGSNFITISVPIAATIPLGNNIYFCYVYPETPAVYGAISANISPINSSGVILNGSITGNIINDDQAFPTTVGFQVVIGTVVTNIYLDQSNSLSSTLFDAFQNWSYDYQQVGYQEVDPVVKADQSGVVVTSGSSYAFTTTESTVYIIQGTTVSNFTVTLPPGVVEGQPATINAVGYPITSLTINGYVVSYLTTQGTAAGRDMLYLTSLEGLSIGMVITGSAGLAVGTTIAEIMPVMNVPTVYSITLNQNTIGLVSVNTNLTFTQQIVSGAADTTLAANSQTTLRWVGGSSAMWIKVE